MAEISVYTDVEVNVDYDDFLEACSVNEINRVIEWLEDNNYIFKQPNMGKKSNYKNNTQDDIFNDMVYKLINNRWKLSKEDQQKIEIISNSIILE